MDTKESTATFCTWEGVGIVAVFPCEHDTKRRHNGYLIFVFEYVIYRCQYYSIHRRSMLESVRCKSSYLLCPIWILVHHKSKWVLRHLPAIKRNEFDVEQIKWFNVLRMRIFIRSKAKFDNSSGSRWFSKIKFLISHRQTSSNSTFGHGHGHQNIF